MKTSRCVLFALLALTTLPAYAQISENFAPLSDTDILNKLHSIDRTEISLGNLVLVKSDDKDAKMFATRMVHDHGDADQWVQALAKQKGIALAEPAIDQQALSELKGGPFNRAYMDGMVSGHAEALRFLAHAKAQSSGPDMTALIGKFHKVVAAHERLAQKLQSKRTF